MPSHPRIPEHARLALAAGVVSTTMPDETVVLDPEGDRYVSLDGVGSRVWELLQASTTLDDIVTRLVDEYDVDRETCEQDVRALLRDLVEGGLVLVSNDDA